MNGNHLILLHNGNLFIQEEQKMYFGEIIYKKMEMIKLPSLEKETKRNNSLMKIKWLFLVLNRRKIKIISFNSSNSNRNLKIRTAKNIHHSNNICWREIRMIQDHISIVK